MEIGRGSEYQRSLGAHMIGKVDRAGRLVPPELTYANVPNHEFWQDKLDRCSRRLSHLMGADAYNAWVDSPEIPDYASFQTHANIYAEKIFEIETCSHEWVTSRTGGDHFNGGSYDNDDTEETYCRHCGALIESVTAVRQ